MEKKAYIIPGVNVMTVKLQQLINFSGGGDQQNDPQVDPESDNGEGPNRSRPHYDVWEDEEE